MGGRILQPRTAGLDEIDPAAMHGKNGRAESVRAIDEESQLAAQSDRRA